MSAPPAARRVGLLPLARRADPPDHPHQGTAADRDQPPDLRLAGLAVSAWLTALAGLHLSAGTSLLLVGLAAGLAGVLAGHLLGWLGRPRVPSGGTAGSRSPCCSVWCAVARRPLPG